MKPSASMMGGGGLPAEVAADGSGEIGKFIITHGKKSLVNGGGGFCLDEAGKTADQKT